METIGYGVTALVTKTKSLTVMKQPFPGYEHEIAFERQVYEKLGIHPRIAKYRRAIKHAFEMDYYPHGCIDKARRDMGPEIPYLKWAEQIAEGLVFIHSKGIIHCDLRSPNVLVTDTQDVVLADFASSSMDGVRVSDVSNNTRYRPPSFDELNPQYTIQDDIFAFGSVVYYLVAAEDPYKDRTDEEVIELYSAGSVASKCWHGEYSSAAQVLDDVRQYKLVQKSILAFLLTRFLWLYRQPGLRVVLSITLPSLLPVYLPRNAVSETFTVVFTFKPESVEISIISHRRSMINGPNFSVLHIPYIYTYI
ncbi:conserved hypothetical protein [Microsporum canis CBS 113480]|uniref:Protein kinase domain-containing protein n=1 Tax=Arthroderma otae (strain ATCC MYA-4605 / CBS 113480) TaxID=554155 RepID=C5FTJ2_ARTOC|nr:conserved hypothetical protein [Microsporum canis CBS 113480]EEQ33195.1 conserved hypothetical protein [Microsporum canis CBS 113480]